MPTFINPAAAFTDALRKTLIDQANRKRQGMLDGIAIQNQLQQQARLEAEARRAAVVAAQQDADRVADIYGPAADLSPEAASTLRAGGYQVDDRTTLPSTRTVAPLGLPAPTPGEALRQQVDTFTQKIYGRPSSYGRRAETNTERLAREAREAAQAERDEARTFRNEQAGAQRTFQGEQNDANRQARADQSAADNDLKLMIAHMTQSANVETRALGNELKRLQVQAAQDKLDAAHADREQAKKTRTQGRTDIRDLAQGLIDDKALDAITGNVGALTPDVLPTSIDARKRLDQLVNKLALGGREQLKGTGAISDFEARMLAAAVSAIDPRAGSAEVRKHLKAIVNMMSDGDAGGNDKPAAPVRRYNPATRKIE